MREIKKGEQLDNESKTKHKTVWLLFSNEHWIGVVRQITVNDIVNIELQWLNYFEHFPIVKHLRMLHNLFTHKFSFHSNAQIYNMFICNSKISFFRFEINLVFQRENIAIQCILLEIFLKAIGRESVQYNIDVKLKETRTSNIQQI